MKSKEQEVICTKCAKKRPRPVKMNRHGFVREDGKTLSSYVCPVCKDQQLVDDAIE